jgi:hypothetical protein
MTTPTLDTLRGADLQTLRQVLESRRARALDVLATGTAVRAVDGQLSLTTDPALSIDGVSPTAGLYRPSATAITGLASKLDIPGKYLGRCLSDHTTLFDQNVNGWLDRYPGRLLLRLLRADECPRCYGIGSLAEGDPSGTIAWSTCPECEGGRPGLVRAVLSDRYRAIDDLDVAVATLQGIQGAGVQDAQISADLTERRMYMRVVAHSVTADASALVRNYRDPETGRPGSRYPLMSAGLRVENSEVGQGAFRITPYVTLQVCSNGQTITKDAIGNVHLGSQLGGDGVVEWSEETLRRNLALITSQATDAVRKFLSPAYLHRVVQGLELQAQAPLGDRPQEIITEVSQRLGFTQDVTDAVFGAFVAGGDVTAGGVMHAVTAVALHVPDGDQAAAMQDAAGKALTYAFAAATRPGQSA